MEKASLKESGIKFFSSGSTILDLALGGGWPLGRVFNIVGDKSTGKTLLAIEAFANFKLTFPNGRMRYAEAESAFDEYFAEQLGFPSDVERTDEMLNTVEEFRDDLYRFSKKGGPGLYILDSLDALTDVAELAKFEKSIKNKDKAKKAEEEGDGAEVEKEKGSYGVAKAKKMSEMFRLLVKDMKKSEISVGIISQIRDKIGVMFGETKTRSGGRALDFYASQVLWLSETGKVNREVNKISRTDGVSIHSKVKKNKVSTPFREADYDIIFSYGIDDEMSMIDWLSEIKSLLPEAAKDIRKQITIAREKKDFPTIVTLRNQLKQDCISLWNKIENEHKPPISKYGSQYLVSK